MTRKFEVQFSSPTDFAPSIVYVSPSPAYTDHFAVGILYVNNISGDFQSPAGIAKTFGFEQNLCKTEQDALTWAKGWLAKKSDTRTTLNEIRE